MHRPPAAFDRAMQLLLIAGLLLALAAYWGGLRELALRWVRSEEYGHGMVLPLIAAWLMWERRSALRLSLGRPSWLGPALLLFAIGLLLLGELSAIFLLMQGGFLLVLAAQVLASGGISLLRVSLLPIALLIFAIPLPYFLDAQLSWGLQLLSSRWGVDLLRLFGISVYLQGNVIDLGSYQLQVVEACSGLRYLYPLMSLGFLAAYLFQAPWWQRGIVFLSTVPITILMNSFRIGIIGLLVDRWGTGQAEGFLHFFEGWIIFMACAALLLAEIWLFARFGARRPVAELLVFPAVSPVIPARPLQAPSRGPLAVNLLLLLLALVTVMSVSGREELRPARAPLAGFPLLLGEWRASELRIAPLIVDKLGIDDYLLADYRNEAGDGVNFYVAYYASQRKGVSPHSPRVCIPGGGWLISAHARRPLALGPEQPPFPINRIVIERDEQRQLVYYWFEQRGRRIANEYRMKWYLLRDSLTRNRTDGALVRVTTPLAPGEPAAAGDRRLQAFLRGAMPELGRYVPE